MINKKNRRFSFSDRILNFDEEVQMECESTPYLLNKNDDLLQQYLVEENSDFNDMEQFRPCDLEEENKQGMLENPDTGINTEKLINDRISEEKKPSEEKKEISTICKVKSEEKTESVLQISDFICNCKKSKCLKLYCECFAKGKLCNSLCNCLDCCNRQEDCKQRKLALRNTYLKARKNEKETEEMLDLDLNSFVLPNCNTKNLGCNCKKSHCKKKYCECFDAGRPCGDHCKCEGCRNYLGAKIRRKDKNHKNENHPVTSTSKINTRTKQKNLGKNGDLINFDEEKARNKEIEELKCIFRVVNGDRKGNDEKKADFQENA